MTYPLTPKNEEEQAAALLRRDKLFTLAGRDMRRYGFLVHVEVEQLLAYADDRETRAHLRDFLAMASREASFSFEREDFSKRLKRLEHRWREDDAKEARKAGIAEAQANPKPHGPLRRFVNYVRIGLTPTRESGGFPLASTFMVAAPLFVIGIAAPALFLPFAAAAALAVTGSAFGGMLGNREMMRDYTQSHHPLWLDPQFRAYMAAQKRKPPASLADAPVRTFGLCLTSMLAAASIFNPMIAPIALLCFGFLALDAKYEKSDLKQNFKKWRILDGRRNAATGVAAPKVKGVKLVMPGKTASPARHAEAANDAAKPGAAQSSTAKPATTIKPGDNKKPRP